MFRARSTMERRVYDGCCTPYGTAVGATRTGKVDQSISGLVDQEVQWPEVILIH
jgi:hypothetical protein